ncbi:MAG: hypothetical protein IT334_12260 [Thermomicrobiales bacterium]|nr:hypothetical protein [Thermomicrobiales bacterium]
MDDFPRPINPNDPTPDSDFADRFDRAFHQAAAEDPGAGALDPNLWARIQAEAGIDQTTSANASAGAPKAGPTSVDTAGTLHGRGRYTAPAAWWRWGLAVVLLTALASTLVLSLDNDEPNRNPTSGVVSAPLVMSPIAELSDTCDVEPLTVAEVLEIVTSVPPPGGEPYPHTDTWLPDTNGAAEFASGTRSVVTPDITMYRAIQHAVDRYLVCQETGTNFQVWALESAPEVQRQVTQVLLYENGDAFGPEIDEAMLIAEIERLGPQLRRETWHEGIGGTYLTLVIEDEDKQLRANQVPEAAFITTDGNVAGDTYAWIGLELQSKADGVVIIRHGAGTEPHESNTPREQDLPVVGTLILRFDDSANAWKVEWFIPSI